MNPARALIVAFALAAALPSTALAGTAAFTGGTFSYTANPGEQNYLLVDVATSCGDLGTSPCFTLSEVSGYVIAPPPGCVSHTFSQSAIYCPIPSAVVIATGDRNDTVLDWNGPSTIDAGTDNDTVFGHGGDDLLVGGEGTDNLLGGLGNDTIDGGPGGDLLESPVAGYGISEEPSPSDSGGTDILKGGGGLDTVSYQLRIDPLTITLDGRANDGAPGENDTIANDVETVVGGQANDAMTGSGQPDGLYGYSGNDTLRGGPGDDTLDGGPGSDRVFGETGADTVSGGHDEDTVDGGPGRDNIYGEYAIGCNGLDACLGGADQLLAHDGERDLISCGVGTDRAEIDPVDVVRDIPGATECEALVVPRQSARATTRAIKRCRALKSSPRRKACLRAVHRAGAGR